MADLGIEENRKMLCVENASAILGGDVVHLGTNQLHVINVQYRTVPLN